MSVLLSLFLIVSVFSVSTSTVFADSKAKSTYVTSVKPVEKGIKVSWKTCDSVTGYQLMYSTSSKFEQKKVIKIKGKDKSSTHIKNLKSGKKYYVKIRTYKVKGDNTKYSSWSDYKSVKTLKAKNTLKTYYWVENGKVYHTTKNCTTLKRSKSILSGKSVPSGRRLCKVCG